MTGNPLGDFIAFDQLFNQGDNSSEGMHGWAHRNLLEECLGMYNRIDIEGFPSENGMPLDIVVRARYNERFYLKDKRCISRSKLSGRRWNIWISPIISFLLRTSSRLSFCKGTAWRSLHLKRYAAW